MIEYIWPIPIYKDTIDYKFREKEIDENDSIIIFPSWLEHGIDMLGGERVRRRISLAFNVWMKGEIGHGERGLNKIIL